MQVLAVDVGTGTQDILLLDTGQPLENCVQLVLPSPTEIAARRIAQATREGQPVLLVGTIQGGGPCHWALERHLRMRLPAYATPEAAQTFDDDPDVVRAMGVHIVSEDEARALEGRARRVTLRDLDLEALRRTLATFGVETRFDGLALGCLDHGAAPPGYSDRLFRFEHLRRVMAGGNDLLRFAFLPEEVPPYLTRARAMLACARDEGVPMVFMDTGPAAALGALQDPRVASWEEGVVINLGNMHTLVFHLAGTRVFSLLEHHTGEISREQVEDYVERLVAGTLTHREVFDGKGHGVFYAEGAGGARPPVAVTGPQRGKMRGSRLEPYFAAPHGAMMLTGCFGLLYAFAQRHPSYREPLLARLGAAG
jgi:uncharacterized protein (DUF1786 family)